MMGTDLKKIVVKNLMICVLFEINVYQDTSIPPSILSLPVFLTNILTLSNFIS